MKHSWKAPPWAKSLSYRILPSRRRLARLIEQIDRGSLDLAGTQEYLSRQINTNPAFLLTRPGGTESEGLDFFIRRRLASRQANRPAYPNWFRNNATIESGVFFSNDFDLDAFSTRYLSGVLDSDVVSYGLFAPGALGTVRNAQHIGVNTTHHHNLEPWIALKAGLKPWTLALEGRKVLIVHPFTKSIVDQFKKRSSITGVKDFLPDFYLSVLAPPVTFSRNQEQKTWVSELEHLTAQIRQVDFDLAIVGAGGYGVPVSAAIKRMGRSAIHLGGITQLLFGIRGKRWGPTWAISDFIDSSWVFPHHSERPPQFETAAEGAYW